MNNLAPETNEISESRGIQTSPQVATDLELNPSDRLIDIETGWPGDLTPPFHVRSFAEEREPTHDPDLVICEFIKSGNGENDIRLVRRADIDQAFDVEEVSDNKRLFTWVIGTNDAANLQALDKISEGILPKPYRDLTVEYDNGLTKALWHGTSLNAHLTRFEVDPEDPCSVKRNVVEILISDGAIFSVDLGGDNRNLLELKKLIDDGRIPPWDIDTVGSFVNLIIERTLRNNDRILDQLDKTLLALGQKTATSPLSTDEISHDLPKLEEALLFFRRKTNQTLDVLQALYRAPKVQEDLFSADESPKEALTTSSQSLGSLLRRVDDMLTRIESIAEAHDRRRKERSDANLELLTIPVGISAPPIIADILCKTLAHGTPAIHEPLIAGSLLMGLIMVAYAKWEHLHPAVNWVTKGWK